MSEKQIGRIVIACWVRARLRADLEEAHLLDARGLVLAGLDDVVLDRVVDLVVGDDGRRHAGGGEGPAPDGCPLDADAQALQLLEVAHRLVGEDVAGAAAGIADQHHLGPLLDLVRDRLQEVLLQHLVPLARSRKMNGASMNGAAREKVDMCAGETIP